MWTHRTVLRSTQALAGLSLVFAGMACDKPVPPPAITAATKPAPKPAPTTQSLLSGPHKRVLLSPLPFVIQAPEAWSVSRHGETTATTLTMLDGQLGSGELHVILSERDTISAERLAVVVDHAKKEQAKLEKLGGFVSVRDLGEVRVIERLEMPAATLTDPVERLIDWRIDLFVPSGLKYEAYELKIIDMTDAAYVANKILLDQVFKTLQYASPGPAPF